jgi:hypothetical protein
LRNASDVATRSGKCAFSVSTALPMAAAAAVRGGALFLFMSSLSPEPGRVAKLDGAATEDKYFNHEEGRNIDEGTHCVCRR